MTAGKNLRPAAISLIKLDCHNPKNWNKGLVNKGNVMCTYQVNVLGYN